MAMSRIRCFLLLCVLVVGAPHAGMAQTGSSALNDLWWRAWQNCDGQPCLNIQNVASSGPWTGPGSLNDLFFRAFGTCSGVPCLTVTGAGGGGGAPTTSQYWLGAADASLPNAKNLGALATGLVLNTGGTPSAFAGNTCTNQFPRSENGSGAWTCASVALTADVTGQLPWANIASPVPNDTAFAGDLLVTAIAAPATPSAGTGRVYVDSTSKNVTVKDDAGVVKHGVQTVSCPANQALTAVNDAGAGTCAALSGGGPLSRTRPNEAKTNSTTTDIDYTSIYTVPANTFTASAWLHVRLIFKHVTGSPAANVILYLKLGTTKVYQYSPSLAPGASLTRYYTIWYDLAGTAAPGASVPVDVGSGGCPGCALNNTLNASVATNGALDIVPGVIFSSSTLTDTLTLLDAVVEQKS